MTKIKNVWCPTFECNATQLAIISVQIFIINLLNLNYAFASWQFVLAFFKCTSLHPYNSSFSVRITRRVVLLMTFVDNMCACRSQDVQTKFRTAIVIVVQRCFRPINKRCEQWNTIWRMFSSIATFSLQWQSHHGCRVVLSMFEKKLIAIIYNNVFSSFISKTHVSTTFYYLLRLGTFNSFEKIIERI